MQQSNTYAANLDILLNNYLAVPSNMDPILGALGCSAFRYNDNVWRLHPNTQPDPAHEALVHRTLVQLMRTHMKTANFTDLNSIQLLEGLLLNNRWRACLADLDDAHDLAGLFMHLILVTELIPTASERLYPVACVAFHAWIGLTKKIEGDLDMETLVRHLFGDAWYELVVRTSNMKDFDAPNLVRMCKPPFKPGLVAGQAEPSSVELPSFFS